jgi:hypothetical protein
MAVFKDINDQPPIDCKDVDVSALEKAGSTIADNVTDFILNVDMTNA